MDRPKIGEISAGGVVVQFTMSFAPALVRRMGRT